MDIEHAMSRWPFRSKGEVLVRLKRANETKTSVENESESVSWIGSSKGVERRIKECEEVKKRG